MKNEKLAELFTLGNVVIPIYFLQKYKELKIEMDEFIFLMYLYNQGNKFIFDPAKFSSSLNITLEEVMTYIFNLGEKKIIRVEVMENSHGVKEDVVVLDDFYNKMSLLTIENVNQSSKSIESDIFSIIESEFGRTLSPIEYEIIKAWLESDVNEELIKAAVKETVLNGVSNLRYMDKIIYEWGKLGIKTVEDLEKRNKKKKQQQENDEDLGDLDIDVVDWEWYNEE